MAGSPSSRSASTAALIGSVEKYAGGPSDTIARSIGVWPSLSGMRASSRLIATRSSDQGARPAGGRGAAPPPRQPDARHQIGTDLRQGVFEHVERPPEHGRQNPGRDL